MAAGRPQPCRGTAGTGPSLSLPAAGGTCRDTQEAQGTGWGCRPGAALQGRGWSPAGERESTSQEWIRALLEANHILSTSVAAKYREEAVPSAQQLVRLHLEHPVSKFGTSWDKTSLDSQEKIQSRAQGWCSIGKSRLREWIFSPQIPARSHREDRLFSDVHRGKGQEPTSWNKGRVVWELGKKSFPEKISLESGCCNRGCRKSISGHPQVFIGKGPVALD